MSSITTPGERRRSSRQTPLSATAFVHGQWREYVLKDISRHGLGIVVCPERFTPRQRVSLDLLQHRWPVAEDLEARVVRVNDDTAGLDFDALSEEQSRTLERLTETTAALGEESLRRGQPDFSALVLRYKDRPRELKELATAWRNQTPRLLHETIEDLAAGRRAEAAGHIDRLANMAACIRATALGVILREIAERLATPGADIRPEYLSLLSREIELVCAGLSRLCQS